MIACARHWNNNWKRHKERCCGLAGNGERAPKLDVPENRGYFSGMFIPSIPLRQSPRYTSELRGIPSGAAGTVETLEQMKRLALEGKRDLSVRLAAMDIIRDVPQKMYRQEAEAIQRFVRDKIRYTQDIHNVETLADPATTLELGQGDCDDKAVLVASLLGAVGHPTKFVAVGFRPGRYEHVYVETKIGNEWVPVETTEPVELGWMPRGVLARLERVVK